jgi:arrestin-related trafficking adapter 9
MVPPNAHVISLEPISRRLKRSTKSTSPKTKRKTEKETTDLENASDSPRPTSSPNPEESVSQRPSSDHGGVPQSPTTGDIQSETSGESVASSSTGWSFRLRNVPPSTSTRDSRGGHSNSSIASKTITATIELLKGGCLPGDNIPLRVSIQHTKFIKSMHGIIITLYRQGRIDSAPPLSLFTGVKGKAAQKLKHEEYYPKSKTGFGGLSLSSAGSSHVFRKDLSQVFAPIIIDPTTLSTVVTASIRVPEDVFPTVTGVPGQMISFRYHIEVVLDLGGKLAGQDKHIPQLGMVNSSHIANNGFPGNGREGGANTSIVTAWGGSVVDTDNIRREKSVVACLFEIIVGTTDSARLRRRGNTANDVQMKSQSQQKARPSTLANDPGQEHVTQQEDIMGKTVTEPCYPYHGTAQYPADESQTNGEPYDYEYLDSNHGPIEQSQHHPPAFVPVPLPEVPAEEGLTEKERIQRAEERLLPSQPPQDDAPSSSRTILPSAPEDPHEDIYGLDDGSLRALPTTTDPVSSMGNDCPTTSTMPITPLAPDLEDLTPQGTHNTTEDKQELERRRLMAEASSPADFPDEHDNAGEGSSGTQYEPTAPVLTEEDEYGGNYPGVGEGYEGLPRYER